MTQNIPFREKCVKYEIFVSANKRAGRQGIMLEMVLSSYEKISEPFQINSIKKRLRVREFSNIILSIIY